MFQPVLHRQPQSDSASLANTEQDDRQPSVITRSLAPPNLLHLQRTIGNRAVTQLIQRETKQEPKPKAVHITTPLPKSAKKQQDGSATVTVGGVNVTILGDVQSTDESLKGHGQTSVQMEWTLPGADFDDNNKVTKFDKLEAPTAVIQTTYGPDVNPDSPSAYGRGTTEEDKKAGKTTLGFHEGMHGQDFLTYFTSNPIPKFTGKIGMTTDEFQAAVDTWDAAMDEYEKKLSAHSIAQTDCVGDAADFCKAEEKEGEDAHDHDHPH